MTISTSLPGSSLGGTLAVWLVSDAAARLARIGATVMAARMLAVEEIGLVALVLAIGEILKALAENGVGQRIVAAPANELDAVCNRAAQIFRLWCFGLFGTGCAVAAGLLAWSGDTRAPLLLVVFCGQFLFMPLGLVPCFLAMRRGRSRAVATVAGGQTVLSAALAVALLAVWPSPLAMILPRLLTALPWALAMRALAPWRANPGAGMAPLPPFLRFGGAVMGIEALRALRQQADKLIVGAVLGLDALGVWFFAMNAGLGLATSFANAFAIALFPRLCASAAGADRRAALRSALVFAGVFLVPAITAQALLAPFYVPMLYGDAWAEVAGLVSILCLAIGIALSARFGLEAIAITYLCIAILGQAGAAILIFRRFDKET